VSEKGSWRRFLGIFVHDCLLLLFIFCCVLMFLYVGFAVSVIL
jgi:hypothetical protein